jgi:hypothetical protein
MIYRLIILSILLIHCDAADDPALFKSLERQRQEKLYYDEETLPATVKRLIESDLAVADFNKAYRDSKDEVIRFNLVLIVDKRVRHNKWNAQERDAAMKFFQDALNSDNPWIITEAVYSLGNAQVAAALPAVKKCLDSKSGLAVFHATIAYIAITGERPQLTQEQVAKIMVVQKAFEGSRQNDLADQEIAEYLSQKVF